MLNRPLSENRNEKCVPQNGTHFLMLQQLPEHQQNDAGDAEEAGDQRGDEIDLEDDARVGRHEIQKPQADEAGNGIDGDLPQTADLGEEKLQHQNADQDGNE